MEIDHSAGFVHFKVTSFFFRPYTTLPIVMLPSSLTVPMPNLISALEIPRCHLAKTDQVLHTAHMRRSPVDEKVSAPMGTVLTYSFNYLYINTHFMYNISMNVKTDLPRLDKLRQIMDDRQGLLLTSDLAHFDIPRTYLSIMEQNGEIERVSRGAYRSTSAFIEDELFSFQSRYGSTIFSHETALYLHDLTDRAPLAYSITAPSGYHSQVLNDSGHKIFYVSRDLFDLGIIPMNTPHGNQVRATDLERTICDIVRSRNQIDVQVRNAALKEYVKNKNRNLNRLHAYAKQFRIQTIVRDYLEILL